MNRKNKKDHYINVLKHFSPISHLFHTLILSFTLLYKVGSESLITGLPHHIRDKSVSLVTWSKCTSRGYYYCQFKSSVAIRNGANTSAVHIFSLVCVRIPTSPLSQRCKFFWQTSSRQRIQLFLILNLFNYTSLIEVSSLSMYLSARRSRWPWCSCIQNTGRLRPSPRCLAWWRSSGCSRQRSRRRWSHWKVYSTVKVYRTV